MRSSRAHRGGSTRMSRMMLMRWREEKGWSRPPGQWKSRSPAKAPPFAHLQSIGAPARVRASHLHGCRAMHRDWMRDLFSSPAKRKGPQRGQAAVGHLPGVVDEGQMNSYWCSLTLELSWCTKSCAEAPRGSSPPSPWPCPRPCPWSPSPRPLAQCVGLTLPKKMPAPSCRGHFVKLQRRGKEG